MKSRSLANNDTTIRGGQKQLNKQLQPVAPNLKEKSRPLQYAGHDATSAPFVALGCILIPFAVAIWWFWSRGCGQKAKGTIGLLTDGDKNARSEGLSTGRNAHTEEPSGYELHECWPDTQQTAQQTTPSTQQSTKQTASWSVKCQTKVCVSCLG